MSASSPLTISVSTLSQSLNLLNSTITTLDTATLDFPRLTKVLAVNRHFELLSEPEIQAAQAALQDEILPEFQHLLRRVEGQLERMERREKSLIAKSELQKGRLEGGNRGAGVGRAGGGGAGVGVGVSGARVSSGGWLGDEGTGGGAKDNAEKMRQLRAQKGRLAHTVERLELQRGQKHRQLRMSMSYKGVV